MRSLTEFWHHLTGDEPSDGARKEAGVIRPDDVVAREGQGAADMLAIQIVRRRVFHDEQGFIGDVVTDHDDPRSFQALATIPHLDGLPEETPPDLIVDGRLVVSVGRLTLGRTPGSEAQITWVATLPEYRGAGAGAAVMRLMLRAVDEAGAPSVRLSAQGPAVPFYRRLGFTAIGAPYDIRGMSHQMMSRWRGTTTT
jgi:predicted GNAT family N-acyltransferase